MHAQTINAIPRIEILMGHLGGWGSGLMGLIICGVVGCLNTHRAIHLSQSVFDFFVLLILRKLSLRIVWPAHFAIERTQPKVRQHIRWIFFQDLLYQRKGLIVLILLTV